MGQKMENPGPARRAMADSRISNLDTKAEYAHKTSPQKSDSEQNLEVMSDGDEGHNPSLGALFCE